MRPSQSSQAAEVMMTLRKVLTWLAVTFVLFYMIQAPQHSAQLVRGAGHAFGDAASSFTEFLGSLV